MSVKPEDVVCPHCQAEPSEPCFKPSGEPLGAPHARREKHASKLAAQKAKSLTAPERIVGERWRRIFVACRVELEARDDWTLLAAEQLEQMVKALKLAEDLEDKVAADPMVQGSQKQAVANPLAAIALRRADKALALAKALKLTPDTRGARAAPNADGAGVDDPADDDELAELDELHRKRLEKAGGGRRRK